VKASIKNPEENKLPSGVAISDVEDAVTKSGYPLQLIISELIQSEFYLQHEWSFIDQETKKVRNMDILASKYLYGDSDQGTRVRPELNLLIECKQSELPYVFFITPTNPNETMTPDICGLNSTDIEINTDDDLSTWVYPIREAVNLNKHEFMSNVIPCITFSKSVRKNRGLDLSGSSAYNSLIHPLIKAIDFYKELKKPRSTHVYFDCHYVKGIGVLDAPMICSRTIGERNELFFSPWVRLYRSLPIEENLPFKDAEVCAIDIVHKNFFSEYINNHLIPYTKYFSKQIIKHSQVIADNKAYVKGMGTYHYRNVEDKLEKRKMSQNKKKIGVLFNNIKKLVKK